MANIKRSPFVFFIYCFLEVFASIFVLGVILSSPSEAGRAIFLGLSFSRWIMVLGIFIAFLVFAFLAFRGYRDQAWAEQTLTLWFDGGRFSRVTGWFIGISLGLGWIGCFLPAYRTGALSNYWVRIQPVMAFILFTAIATLAVFFIRRSTLHFRDLKDSKIFKLTLILSLGSFLILLWMFFSRFGLSAREDFWYGAGVPILAGQLIIAIVGGILFSHFERRWKTKYLDVLIFFLLYAITAFLWAREPLQKSFLFIGPYPPDRVLYPFADSMIFDMASQFALIGQRLFLFGGYFFERPLYLSFLVYLHSIFGQNYEVLMAAQAALFAILPPLIYLIGRSLNMRAVGVSAALVASLRGVNAIAASNMIDMANPKMILTDFPTAIVMAWITWLMCEWLKQPRYLWHYALWIGGAIGIAVMLRTNSLILLVLLPLYALLKSSLRWKLWLFHSLLIVLAVFTITLPWELRNNSLGIRMYAPIVEKFQAIIEQRYESPADSNSSLPLNDQVSSLWFKSTYALLRLIPNADFPSANQSCTSVACFVSNHFLHNIVTSVLVLPTSPVLDDLHHTVKESHPYWQADWNGVFQGSSLFFFLLNILFILLGISIAWGKSHLTGITPLAVFMSYNLSNAFARTSGGRYIVPTDWILVMYFLLGMLGAVTWLANSMGIQWSVISQDNAQGEFLHTSTRREFPNAILILLFLIGIGALIPLSEMLHPERYRGFDISQALAEREQTLTDVGLTPHTISAFLQTNDANALVGRVLYPRFYNINEGEVFFYPYVEMGFPRTAFLLIGPQGEQKVILPGNLPANISHASDAIVLGCSGELYFDAIAVIPLNEQNVIYTRTPPSELTCPLRQPVCNDNRVCR